MTTDENIIQCYTDLVNSVIRTNPLLTEYENDMAKINRQYMLGKFELWMQEDLQRIGLINNTKEEVAI